MDRTNLKTKGIRVIGLGALVIGAAVTLTGCHDGLYAGGVGFGVDSHGYGHGNSVSYGGYGGSYGHSYHSAPRYRGGYGYGHGRSRSCSY